MSTAVPGPTTKDTATDDITQNVRAFTEYLRREVTKNLVKNSDQRETGRSIAAAVALAELSAVSSTCAVAYGDRVDISDSQSHQRDRRGDVAEIAQNLPLPA